MFASIPSTPIPLGFRSLLLLPIVSFVVRAKMSSSGVVRYVPGSFAGKGVKVESLDQLERKDDGLVRTGVSGRFPFQNSVLNAARKEVSVSDESIESTITSYEDVYFSDLEEVACDEIEPLEEHELEKMEYGQTREHIHKSAISLLASRSYSAHELRKKLVRKKYPVKIVESVISDLQSRGLQNDSLYAESFSRSRWLSLSWGPRRIKRALLEKGVSENDAVNATSQLFEDEVSSEEQGSLLGMSKGAFDRLFAQASKQWLRGRGKPLQNHKSSMVRWLQYRGFDWAVTKHILKKLETEYPTS